MLLPNVMKIKVKYFAGFRTLKKRKEDSIELPENTTVFHLLKQLDIPGDEGKFVLINGNRESEKYVLKKDDEVGIFPLIGGG